MEVERHLRIFTCNFTLYIKSASLRQRRLCRCCLLSPTTCWLETVLNRACCQHCGVVLQFVEVFWSYLGWKDTGVVVLGASQAPQPEDPDFVMIDVGLAIK